MQLIIWLPLHHNHSVPPAAYSGAITTGALSYTAVDIASLSNDETQMWGDDSKFLVRGFQNTPCNAGPQNVQNLNNLAMFLHSLHPLLTWFPNRLPQSDPLTACPLLGI